MANRGCFLTSVLSKKAPSHQIRRTDNEFKKIRNKNNRKVINPATMRQQRTGS